MVDDLEVSIDTPSWREKLGYVSQSVMLIDATIKENIAFGVNDKNIDKNQLNLSIDFAGLKYYINSLEKKENTFVGERGVRISGGQKQRIGIARALYFNPEILLLDEATNSLDKKTENDILDRLVKIKNQLTVVIVSHDDKPFRVCDKVYEIDKLASQI